MIIFSDHGLIDYYRLESKLDAIKEENAILVKENFILKRVIKRLHENDPDLIEHIATNELGMVGKDDVIFLINKYSKKIKPTYFISKDDIHRITSVNGNELLCWLYRNNFFNFDILNKISLKNTLRNRKTYKYPP